MKPPGITPPLIAFDELEALAVLARLDLDVAVAELAAAAGLLLVAAVRLGGLADRLEVRDPRRVQLDLGAEAALHPVDDHLDVDLRQPGDDLLAGLRVAVDVERRVLLGEAPDRASPPSPRRPWSSPRRRTPSPAPAGRAAGSETGVSFAASTSPARVSRSFATAPMSPGPSSSIGVISLPSRRRELADALLLRAG